jgi:hypothetical protein
LIKDNQRNSPDKSQPTCEDGAESSGSKIAELPKDESLVRLFFYFGWNKDILSLSRINLVKDYQSILPS